MSPHLHNGEEVWYEVGVKSTRWFLDIGQDQEIGRQYISIPVEIKRAQCQPSGMVPCDSAYAQGPFQGLDWREIKSWCPIEWAILGKTFLARVIIP